MRSRGVVYDGTSIRPFNCMVRPWVDDDIDPAVREQAFAGASRRVQRMVVVLSAGRTAHNTRAMVYNYKEGWWTQGRMSRSAGMSSSYTAHPIMADDLVAFQHEVRGELSECSTPVQLPLAETFDLNLNSGSRLTTVKQMMPDVEAIEATDSQQSVITNGLKTCARA